MSEESQILRQDSDFYDKRDLYEVLNDLYLAKDLISCGIDTEDKVQKEIRRVEIMLREKKKQSIPKTILDD